MQKVDNVIHRINLYPLNSTIIGFPNTYPLDSDLSAEQPRPAGCWGKVEVGKGSFSLHNI